jgi:polyvinyl alcohol dehydrogenase (cytochrome)
MAGQNVANWRYQPQEDNLTVKNIGKATPKWVATLDGDVSATPAVVDDAVYVPDWGGSFSRLDAATGAVVWKTNVGAIAGIPGAKSRTSPTVVGNKVLFGTQQGAFLVALDKDTGAVIWRTKLDNHPLAIDTASPVVSGGTVFVGVASLEEASATDPNYTCCSFIGSALAVDLETGAIKWKTYTIDSSRVQTGVGGYSGAAVWGSTPVVDSARGSLYITTGNNYDAPDSVLACEDNWRNSGQLTPDPCEPQDNGNYVDAVMSLDMTTGRIKWAHKLGGFDAWTVACIPGLGTSCPSPYGPDYDFGQGAMLIPTPNGDILAAGQKSGVMWALNPDNGSVIWGTLGGPGSSLGGMEWGSATDGQRIYYAISNLYGIPVNLVNPPPGTPTSTNAGLWGAIDVLTGRILWQTADPNFAPDPGAVSVANGIVFAGSLGRFFGAAGSATTKPTFFALDADTGAPKWSFVSGGSVNSGASIVRGTVYWGSGYRILGPELGDGNNKLYAFRV